MEFIFKKDFVLENGTEVSLYIWENSYSFSVEGELGRFSHELSSTKGGHTSIELNDYYAEGEPDSIESMIEDLTKKLSEGNRY